MEPLNRFEKEAIHMATDGIRKAYMRPLTTDVRTMTDEERQALFGDIYQAICTQMEIRAKKLLTIDYD